MRVRLAAVIAVLVVAMTSGSAGASVAGFEDVSTEDYFAAPVTWMNSEGITFGTSLSTFSPDRGVTRGVAGTFIWRMEGSPATGYVHGFTDVTVDWQQAAVAWLAEMGITEGTSPTLFSPDVLITRGEFAVMLWRLAGEPAVGGSLPFPDLTKSWQFAAVKWMAENGISTGTSTTTFSPDASVTRGQIATFLYRYSGSPPVVISSPSTCGAVGTTSLPSMAGRAVIDASGLSGTVVLDRANTVYDFKNVSASRDITIAASNVEARNIRGGGARRIGERDGLDYVDSGFRNFEFTYITTQNGGGGDIIRPYFVGGVDLNPDGTVGSGSPAHIYAYQGDIIDPILDDMIVRGWIADPNAPDPHNDGVHFTGIAGGRVFNPTIRNSTIYSGSAFSVLLRHTYGRLTIEGSTFLARYGAFFAVMGDARDVSPTVEILWRSNTLLSGSDAIFRSGYDLAPGSCGLQNVSVE